MIQEEKLRHAAFWQQDVCVKCDSIVGDTEEEVLLVECPRCGAEEARCTAQSLVTLLSLIDRSESEEGAGE